MVNTAILTAPLYGMGKPMIEQALVVEDFTPLMHMMVELSIVAVVEDVVMGSSILATSPIHGWR